MLTSSNRGKQWVPLAGKEKAAKTDDRALCTVIQQLLGQAMAGQTAIGVIGGMTRSGQGWLCAGAMVS